jgi:serine protease Do
MKQFFLSMLFCSTFLLNQTVFAQKDSSFTRKEKREIIIQNDNDNEQRIIVQVDGDGVKINGKSYTGEMGDNVIIRKFNFDGDDEENGFQQKTEVTSDSIAFLGVMTKAADNSGAEITEVSPNTAAENAGLKSGDVILKIDDQKITDPSALNDAVKNHKPYDEVEILFLRNGKEKKTKATLQLKKVSRRKIFMMQSGGSMKSAKIKDPTSKPKLDEMEINVDIAELLGESGFDNDNVFSFNFPSKEKLGLKIQDTEEEKGVKVLEVVEKSLAAKAGLEKDDVIIEIDGEKISNTDQARTRLKLKEEKVSYLLKINRNGSIKTIEIKKPKKLKTADL